MQQTLVNVVSRDSVGPFAQVRFVAEHIAHGLQSGQAILARTPQAYLRQTWWPCAHDREGFSILVAPSQVENLRLDDRIDILGSVGRGFQVDATSRNVLLIAAASTAQTIYVAPLLALAERALADNRSVTLAYPAPDADLAYPVSALPPALEVIRAIDEDLMKLLPDAISWADQIFICGAAEFSTRIAALIADIRLRTRPAFAQTLDPIDYPCGIGVCRACWNGTWLSCAAGPVFNLM